MNQTRMRLTVLLVLLVAAHSGEIPCTDAPAVPNVSTICENNRDAPWCRREEEGGRDRSDMMLGDDCASSTAVSALILIISASGNAERRNAQRRTWIRRLGEGGGYGAHRVCLWHRFIVGHAATTAQRSQGGMVTDDIMAVDDTTDDVVAVDAPDGYRALPAKVRAAFAWAARDARARAGPAPQRMSDEVIHEIRR